VTARFHILLVEDNPGDATLVRRALDTGRLRPDIVVVTDGVLAVDYLRRKGPHAGARRPDLVLLDMNLPKKDGREVLQELKADDELKHIPIVVLTTSDADDDVRRIYDLHANCFVTKPMELDDFMRVIRAIEEFWLGIARIPSR
jgi:CheY-like chemotaxis protein